MTVILGIDAAWTDEAPSGVALASGTSNNWVCHAVAPSYDSFVGLARGVQPNWTAALSGGSTPIDSLLCAAERLAGAPVDLITLDMPISTMPFSARRQADRLISENFGARWCSAHSPNSKRPGKVGSRLSSRLTDRGYRIATASIFERASRELVEVYPHVALLSLLRRQRRVPYKVCKTTRYWPGTSIADRVASLLSEFRLIDAALRAVFGNIGLVIPSSASISRLNGLKCYEDALDALVCCWVGTLYVNQQATALGDETAAIWCPTDVVALAGDNHASAALS